MGFFKDHPEAMGMLKAGVEARRSAGDVTLELNERFHAAISRNAVMGAASRAGLSFHSVPRRGAAVTSAARRAKRLVINQDTRFDVLPEVETPALPPEPVVDAKIPQARRRTVLTLRPDDCRWPVGDPRDPDFFFCGDTTGGGPYCAGHTLRAMASHQSHHQLSEG